MLSNHAVAERWAKGKVGKSTHMVSTGEGLYSYNLLIGYRDTQGRLIVLDYTMPSGYFRSRTTSHHVSLAKSQPNVIVKMP